MLKRISTMSLWREVLLSSSILPARLKADYAASSPEVPRVDNDLSCDVSLEEAPLPMTDFQNDSLVPTLGACGGRCRRTPAYFFRT